MRWLCNHRLHWRVHTQAGGMYDDLMHCHECGRQAYPENFGRCILLDTPDGVQPSDLTWAITGTVAAVIGAVGGIVTAILVWT